MASVISVENGNLVVKTPYNLGFVTALKSLPASERKYDAGRKVWIVEARHGEMLASWIDFFIGDTVTVPSVTEMGDRNVRGSFKVKYVGCSRERTDGRSSAYGLVDGEWKILFPEQVLRNFFDGSVATPGNGQSYYGLLGVSKTASEAEIASGFRRMAKLWHPDVNKDDNAADIFMMIKSAYDVLSDEGQRARYDAGLVFESITPQEGKTALDTQYGYRSPLLSGVITIEGIRKLSMIEVERILSWEDIVNDQGQTLVVSWPSGAKEPVEEWL